MKKPYYFILLFFLSKNVICQVVEQKIDGQNFQNYLLSVRDRVIINNANNEEKIEGSPYLDNEYSFGEVNTKDGIYKGIKMKYHILDDAFLIDFNNRLLYLEATDYVKKIQLNGDTFVVKLLPNSKKNGDFLIEKSKGDISLYIKKNMIFRPYSSGKAIETSPKPAAYLPKPNKYYIQMGLESLVNIDKIKDFYLLFPKQEEALKKFVKSENLNFKA